VINCLSSEHNKEVTISNPGFEIHLVRIPAYSHNVRISGRYKSDPAVYGDYASYFLINGLSKKTEKKQVMRELTVLFFRFYACYLIHYGIHYLAKKDKVVKNNRM
jgi:hypothetical protein